MRGATLGPYIVARLLLDMATLYALFQILFVSSLIYGMDTTGWQTLGVLFAISTSLYYAAFNVLMYYYKFATVLRFIFLAVQSFLIWFSGLFVANYLEEGGQSGARMACRLGGFSPPVQLLYGLFFTQYRYPVFVASNGESTAAGGGSEDVSPVGEYGAKVPFEILLISGGVYAAILALFLLVGKKSVPAERGEVAPEEDDYEQPATVGQEVERIVQ